MNIRLYDLRYEIHKKRERALMWLVWKLPKEIIMWSTIRLVAHGTSGAFGNQVVPELTAMDALKRWDDPRGGDRVVGQATPG